MGHIKRMCKEEVYCKYCKIYTHSTRACRTYPVTSSRKNTPEKRSSEDIEREVSRRVQEEVQHILNDLSTNRRVTNTQETSHPKQAFGQKEVTSQVNDIPKRGQNVQNLIGDYQRPSEVFDRDTRGSGKTEQTGGSENPILNQQWDEPLQTQPPTIPTAVPTFQQNPHNRSQTQVQETATNKTSHQFETSAGGQQNRSSDQRSRQPAPVTRENASTFMMRQQVETPLNEQQESLLNRGMTDQLLRVQGNVSTPTRYRRFDQMKGKQCNCYIQPTNEDSNQDGRVTTIGKRNPHTEHAGSVNSGDKYVRDEKESDRSEPQECKVTRILPDEEVNFMDLVRDSVTAQARTGPKPMFENNYFVGDNNWRTVAKEKPDVMRQINESRNRSSIAVQTAVSLLGEEDKPAQFVQTGISRMKTMGNNEGVYDTQSPLVVEPAKNGNSTGWSTNSFNLPEVHQNTSVRQQCKELPDLTMPPPPIQDHTQPQGQGEANTNGCTENAILRVIERMTDTMEQQMRLSATRSEYNMQQNTKVMDQFIKSQDRRDLDPALMDILTFTGEEPEKCLEWITWIKNVCRQSGRSFQQELTNKSRLVVQNFLSALDKDISKIDLIEKVLQMFSDIPTTTQAIIKLKAMRQGENETILAYNQRYKTLVEQVEGRTIECITSPVAMEMNLGTIIPPLRKSIKNSLFWNSKHAPNTVGRSYD